MAFAGRFGSHIRQNMSHALVSNGQVPVTSSMLNAIRCISSSKLFIGGLSYGTDDQSLKEAFTSFADVAEGLLGLSLADILEIMIFPLTANDPKGIVGQKEKFFTRDLQVPLKRDHHFICTTFAKEDRATPICDVVQHPMTVCACQGILIMEKDPYRILGQKKCIYTHHLHNVDTGATELANFERSVCNTRHVQLAVRSWGSDTSEATIKAKKFRWIL